MGFKLAFITSSLLILVAGGSAAYIKYQKNEIAMLQANSIVLTGKIEEQNASIDNYLVRQQETTDQINSLAEQNQQAMREVNQLRNTFQKHSLGNLALAKPGLIEKIINKGTKKVGEDFVALTNPNMFDETPPLR
jgi:hypothetical protein|tara:strand:+ start:3685 stop:4089 length:405 start_codon:yes stop_codon:yes gene_type:complete